MNDKDRIRLAEAMFPNHAFAQNRFGDWLMCHDDDWGDDSRIRNVPDPFTDANDDYAVLEWMRKQPEWSTFCDWLADLNYEWAEDYKIGNYARAALKVLDNG